MLYRQVFPLGLMAAVLVVTTAATSRPARGAEAAPDRLVVKFFYFDSGRIEWVVSAEPDRMQKHLLANPDSARLFESLAASVDAAADNEQVRLQMARWLEGERERVSDPGSNVVRLRKAEGIVAYLRAHDFDIQQLVEALLKRTGATSVELVAVHLLDRTGGSSFQLKVVFPDEQVGIGGQGFNVAFSSPEVTYTSVVYALALALYEVYEVINSDSDSEAEVNEDSLPGAEVEPLPPPLPLPSPAEEDVISRTTR